MGEFSQLSQQRLNTMFDASEVYASCEDRLREAGRTVIHEILGGQPDYFEETRYPAGDVFDPSTGAQYYYHTHRGWSGEHGHFHTFIRKSGIPDDLRPSPIAGNPSPLNTEHSLSHIVAISLDRSGQPARFFVTNRWVTGETWYRAEDMIRLLDLFIITHAAPSQIANQWLAALLRLYRPQIATLLLKRDKLIADWALNYPKADVLNDPRLEVIASIPISVNRHIARVRAAIKAP